MHLDNIKRIYFIGIGGIGMSALARYFNAKGCVVQGYDKTQTELTDTLQQEGISIHFEENLELIDRNAELIIYTPAIPKNHIELNYYLENDFEVYKRSKVLGMLCNNNYCIAVSGSHGKTTVSSMIAWLLKETGYDCSAFLGGIAVNFQSNFISGKNDVVVAEADEFDKSFLQLQPSVAIITATDSDHLEIYGSQKAIEESFAEFANHTKEDGIVIAKSSLPILKKINRRIFTYSLQDFSAHLFAKQYSFNKGISTVELNNGFTYQLRYPGIHNIENSIAAIAVALHLGIDQEKIKQAMINFKGVHRRFEVVMQDKKTIFIDDYAHHPEEIKMFLTSVRNMFIGKKITAVFQPHLFSRTNDLKEGFAESLSLADEVLLLPIYPARELPMPNVSSQLIFDLIDNTEKVIVEKDELLALINQNSYEVICTIGAGDIDKLVKPISEILKNKN